MFELNRIRLYNIGPRGARYGDVVLDLSGGGAPIQATSLIPHPGHVTRRPAPATLLVLENGGGKSVLVRMITSTVLPRRQSDRGRQALKDYLVSPAAPSHIALEWVDARSGRVLVTAQVLAPVPGAPAERLFYSFRPDAQTRLDTLPFADDKRRRSLDEYRDALAQIQSPGLELVVEAGQEAWEQHLRGLGLEPDLFAVQQAMNVDEGDAADAFKRTSGRHFVQWFLERALDAERYTELGTAFASYAGNVAQHDQLRLERHFCQRLEGVCAGLAESHEELTEAESGLARARTRLGALAASVRATLALAAGERDGLAGQVDAHGGLIERLHRTASQADLRHKEVWRRTLLLRHDQAGADVRRLAEQIAEARARLAAWELVPALLRRQEAGELHRQVMALLGQAEQAARPARAVRDAAGAAYSGALRHAEQEARARADELDAERESEAQAAAGHDRRAGERDTAAGAARGIIGELERSIAKAERSIARARDDGIVTGRESAAEASERLTAQADEAARRADELALRHQELARNARDLRADADARAAPAASARYDADVLDDRVERQRRTAHAIMTDPLAADLLELAAPGPDALTELDRRADELLSRVRDSGDATRNRLAELDGLMRAGERVLDALSAHDGALLPPRAEVQQIIDILGKHGVDAHTGWHWLEQSADPGSHDETIAGHPHLVDGVVVATAAALGRAREILTEQRPLPQAAVAVGLGDLLREPATADPGFFVVEPTPALHDLEAAEAERSRMASQLAQARAEAERLEKRHAGLTRLYERTSMWREANPAGSAEPFIGELRAKQRAATGAETALERTRVQATSAEREASTAADEAQGARAGADRLRQMAKEARRLADLVAEAGESTERVAALAAEMEEARAEAADLRRQVGQIRRANERRAADAERRRRDASDFAAARARVISGDVREPGPGGASVADLKIRYEKAAENLRSVEVGEDLRRQAETAEQALKDAAAGLSRADPAVAELAERLLSEDPAAADDAARDAAAREVRRRLDELETRHGLAERAFGAVEADLRQASPKTGQTWTSLDEAWAPDTVEDGEALARRAEAEARTARQRAAASESELASLGRRLESARDRHDRLERITILLGFPGDGVAGTADAEPYSGSVEEADAEARAARTGWQDAQARYARARDGCRETVHALRKAISDPEFDTLTAPIKTQVASLDPDRVPPLAREWTRQLGSRVASLAADIEHADRHRGLLVDQLKAYVGEAFSVLSKAERLSTLPASAGVWQDRQVLRIRFAKPDANVLAARVGDVIDREAREQRKVTGMELVLRCVAEAVTRDFHVALLKPDHGGPSEYIPVERMREVFSGGQELTGAIMLYCTLAAVRIAGRGHPGTRHGGMLILDNPIGKASADYLLTLQMSMAAALGVQLIYTTGVEEDRVLATFPLRIRLRNDGDRRSGTRFLHVIDRAVEGNGHQPADGGISAIRLMNRDPGGSTTVRSG